MSNEVKSIDASEIYQHKFLSEFNIGDNYVGVWKVKSCELKIAAGGKNKYTEYYLQDKSAIVKAIHFGIASGISEGDFACIDLLCQDYNNTKAYKILNITPNEGTESTPIDMTLYYDAFDVVEYKERADEVIGSLPESSAVMLIALLEHFGYFTDDATMLKNYPSNNPQYQKIGGALAHSVCLAEACQSLARLYNLNGYDTAVLIGACLLGRVGANNCFDMVNEYEFVPNKKYHLLGVDNVSQYIISFGMPEEKQLNEFCDRILHCLCSNDVTDCKALTKEAFVYSKLIYTDSLVRGFTNAYDKSFSQNTEFSMKDQEFKRHFYIHKPEPFVVMEDISGLECGPIEDRDSVEVEKALSLLPEKDCTVGVVPVILDDKDAPPF